MRKSGHSIGHLFMIITLLLFSCEKRFLDIPHEPAMESQVELLKVYFENYSRNLPSPDPQNFARLTRSGSERTLHWEKTETIGNPEMGILRVPVSYTGQQTFLRDSLGKRYPFKHNTWLVARPRKEGGYKLNLVSYLPLDQTTQQVENPYTAVLEVGDWQGRHEFAVLYRKQGSPLTVRSKGTRTSDKQSLKMAVDNSVTYLCVLTAFQCVGPENYDTESDPDYENTTDEDWNCTAEFLCYNIDGTPIDPIQYPDFDIPDTWYGGNNDGSDIVPSGNNNPTPTDGIDTSELSAEHKALLQIAINIIMNKCGFKVLYNKIKNEGEVKILLGPTGNARYMTSKEIQYNENFPDLVLQDAGTLAHELFHAYQHQLVYGAMMTGLAPNHINIEFEQIVFQDIVNRMSDGGSGGVGYWFNQTNEPGFQAARTAYVNWINALTNHGTAYPDLNSIAGFDATYMMHMNNFKTYGHTLYTVSDIIPTLLPNAIKQFYSNSFNCNN